MIPTRHRTATPRRRPRLTARLAALGAATALAATAVSAVGPGSAPANAAETPAAALTVRLDPGYQHPAFQGWGTALAWFAHVTGGWPAAQRDALADALYGADGLGFTIARYNIGGGDSPETAPYMRAGAAVPGYWNRPGPEAPDWWDPNRADHWNAGADANQRWWLTAAKARGAGTFEAFSNSAPYFMTNSGLASGAVDGWRDNLRSDQYDRFAAYLTGALQRAQSATGVTFDSLSPVNEPDTDYWHAGGRQEGSHWDPASQARMITTLRAALDAKGVTTPIAGMDETNPGKFRSNWESYAPAVRDAVGRLNTHTYGTNGRTGVRDIAKGETTPLWMSEVDLGGSVPQSFTSMSPALDLAQRINDDIRELEPSAWVLWQAVEDYENMAPGRENSNWGLIQTDFTPEDAATEPLRKNKKYWAMANYSRFVRPGARIVNTDDPQTLAAVRPGGNGVVVVHTNPTGDEREVTLNLDGFQTAAAGPVERWTTDATRNLQRDADAAVSGRTLKATVGPGSVTTFVLPTVTGVNASATTGPTATPRRLLNDHSGKALAVATVGGKSTVVQRTPAPADSAQQWTFTKLSATDWGSTAAHRITNAKTGKALSVSNGTLTFASPGSSTAQQWIRSTTGDGHSTLINVASGRLLDVTGESTADGAPVGVHQPTTGANQSWALASAAPDAWQTLSFRHSSKCLDVSGAGTNDGAAVVQYGCATGSNQQWSLRSTGGGYVNVVARHSGKCLDVSGQSTADGAEVFQYSCNGGRNQEWAVRATGDGHLTLTARHSAKCLTVSAASTADGAAAVQRTCDGGAAQQLS
ncbi:RICIN domain-containing protein [Streptomyces sp. NBC_00335]|uniref:RICIN domain-containing protein n=1 Tax=unclassified Streptomyces TaxID=2593676 RepID=UPI002259BFD8|nr:MULTISPECIES: RICIN domain-containing protein [unclassified Streptomyces]MCX5408895.1 RICIN domain-containing protein [Streptomyces sp. NBC_00086]